MAREKWRQAKLDRCASCSLFFVDSVELDFVSGREGLEQGLIRLSRPANQPDPCPGCKSPLHEIHTGFRVRRQSLHPYRDSATYSQEIAALAHCPACGGFVLAEELLVRLTDAFSPKKDSVRPQDAEWFQRFRASLLATLQRPH
jgi:hypothetical protein